MPKDHFQILGLGRATLRGVKKCPKCGTSNGTRGTSCKNKSCDVVFKESGGRKKFSMEACRLDTGTSTRVYSVRVRDKGPDYRGFVQLPIIQQKGINLDESTLMSHSTALCFVEPCQRNFNNSILQCHERKGEVNLVVCSHIKAALRCFSEAVPLTINTSVLDCLNINQEIKEQIWSLIADASGPVVQRVSKNIMAVKCKASPKHPLGYLHFSFNLTSKGESENQFSCSCSMFKESMKMKNREEPCKCPHFYACICAFVNNEVLCDEFSQFIRLEIPVCTPTETPVQMLDAITENDSDPLAKILNDSECRVEILGEDVNSILSENMGEDAIIFSANNIENQSSALKVSMDNECINFSIDKNCLLEDISSSYEINGKEFQQPIEAGTLISPDAMDISATPLIDIPSLATPIDLQSLTNLPAFIHQSEMSPQIENPSSTFLLEDMVVSNPVPSPPPLPPPHAPSRRKSPASNKLNISFIEWLGTVTESINQHMHYQFDGKPNPLVFHVPQKFFDKLKERIILVRKKKLPNNVTTFTRKDSIPMGTFTKYTWSLTNIMHVRYVFDTPHMPLKIFRAFVKNKDGSFVPSWDSLKDEIEEVKTNQPPLKPAQYKTFIRVEIIFEAFLKSEHVCAIITKCKLALHTKAGNQEPFSEERIARCSNPGPAGLMHMLDEAHAELFVRLTSVDQKEPTPFKIEWIPDVLPLSHIGELRIQFEFGHLPHPKRL